ncbi:MAG: ABC transporter permease [Bacillota bacterium]
MTTYLYLGRTGYLRNTAYRWSHMLNNVASAVFGFIYISLWQAVAPENPAAGDPYSRQMMTEMMVLAQVFAWLTTFFPAGLGIQNAVRSGAIALEMARPLPYFAMVLSRESGNIAYHALYRALPIALLFTFTVGFPAPHSAGQLLLVIPSLLLGAYVGLTLTYTIGISALWTTEIRWAHWTYHTMITLLSGGWIPADILPGWLGKIAPYLPFASQQYYPLRIYLGLSGPEGLLVQAGWAAALTLWCRFLTRRALHRTIVQGG